ncbi:MAG TPA: VOC family protein [Polyangiaceae bacterium]|jgi:PhnB protein|nr:VOC family protein [Polyangiaceae bacterium]
MSTTLNPYLNFDGHTEAAMKFYAEALNGKLELFRFGDSPVPVPPDQKNRVMHALLKTEAMTIMASDTPATMVRSPGNAVHLSLSFDNETEQQRVWDKLAAGGKVGEPLANQFFGRFGTLTDKFGTSWMFILPAPPPK